MEPTTTLQASSNDVCSQIACSSHDALHHAQPRMTFVNVNKEGLQTFADKTRNYSTKKTTLTWIKRFEAWRKARGIQQSLENIPTDRLDEVLQFFFC